MITFFVLADLLDGILARMTKGSTWGAFLDSTLDRVADAGVFSGLIIYLVLDDQVALALGGLLCLVGGAVVSYAKARAEGLGMHANVGIAGTRRTAARRLSWWSSSTVWACRTFWLWVFGAGRGQRDHGGAAHACRPQAGGGA